MTNCIDESAYGETSALVSLGTEASVAKERKKLNDILALVAQGSDYTVSLTSFVD